MRKSIAALVVTFLALVIVLLHLGLPGFTRAADVQWAPLFNGRNLDGWYIYLAASGKNNDRKRIFKVEKGMIHVMDLPVTDEKEEFGYIATEKEYSNYHLRLEYKWGEKKFPPMLKSVRDSGLLYHFVGPDKVWPRMMEYQIAETFVGDTYLIDGVEASTTVGDEERPGGRRLYREHGTPYTGRNSVARSEVYERPGWNAAEIIVQGDRFTHILNGKVNNRGWDMKQPDPHNPGGLIPLTRGRICLQAEGAEVFYRNIEIKLLD